MKKIFQFFIAVVMCLSLSTNIYAINDNEHEITTDKPHIILTPNQAGDELTVKLHLSQEMFERQIATMHLSINTSKSIQEYQNAFMLDEGLKKLASIYDYNLSENKIDLLLSNKTKLFEQQEITLGTIRIDSNKDFEIEFTPAKITYVYVNDKAENSIEFDCPAVILSSVSGGDSGDNGQDPADKITVETVVEHLGGSKLELAEESQKVVQTSVMSYLNKHYAEILGNLPEGTVIKAQLSMKNLTESDITIDQKDKIEKVLEDGAKILAYYDISITATAYSKDDVIIPEINGVEISEMASPIKLSMTIPSEFIKKNRQFGIVRLHDNEANGLKSSLANENIITFETDRFSIYTLVAKDYTQAEVNKDPDVLNNSIVKTGDDTSSMLPMIFMAASLLVIIGILEMKRREVNKQK